jgi:ribosomal protein L37AE/L43A
MIANRLQSYCPLCSSKMEAHNSGTHMWCNRCRESFWQEGYTWQKHSRKLSSVYYARKIK